jgi:ribonuclease HI
MIMDITTFKMNFDGCSKGNPGNSGAGAVIYNNLNNEIWNNSVYVGDNTTNNVAEYLGCILGLEQCVNLEIKNLIIEGDSQLIIKQLLGEYKVKSETMIPLYEKATTLLKFFDNIEIKHVYRKFNKRADELSNLGLLKK